jgi:thiosulfate/3-mercaptopyruvate sulfurtransferase
MPCDHPPASSLTRRDVFGRTAALAGLMAGGGAVRVTGAQAPPASPIPGGYAHPEALVGVDWLSSRARDGELLVALMPEEEFEAAHIGASFRIDWPDLEVVDTSDDGIAAWEATVRERIGDLHIAPESSVVVYDNGTLFASRLWWVLRYLGHDDVRILDGGLPAWRAAGHEVETGPVVMTMEKRPPYSGVANPAMLAQRDEVMAALDDPGVVLVDARAPDEYARGHIPGAINVNYPLNATGDPPRWKTAGALREMYEAAGVTPETMVIPYCSSGVRSAVTAFTLWLIGYPHVALYTGSWNEWSELPDAPKAEGDQP